jgi:hypothetical protein
MSKIPFLTDMKQYTFGLENFGEVFRQHFHRVEYRPDDKYLFFFRIDTILALDPDLLWTQIEGKGYALDSLPLDIIGDLRDGYASLVLDISGEGEVFYPKPFDSILRWLKNNNISTNRICIISQNRTLADSYLRHYKNNDIKIFVYDLYISTFAALLAQSEPEFSIRFGFTKDSTTTGTMLDLFLCMNATPRPPRITVLAALLQSGLLEKTKWSLMKEASGKYAGEPELLIEFLNEIGRPDLLEFTQQLNGIEPKIIGKKPIQDSNELAFDIDREAYMETRFSIVTETDFTAGQVMRITEKSIKPLAMGHPFIVVGNPKSLEIIRSFGFETFGTIIDESYDLMPNAAQRFSSIMHQLSRVPSFTEGILGQLLEIGKHNAQHVRSGGLMRTYRDVVERPLVQQLELLATL